MKEISQIKRFFNYPDIMHFIRYCVTNKKKRSYKFRVQLVNTGRYKNIILLFVRHPTSSILYQALIENAIFSNMIIIVN